MGILSFFRRQKPKNASAQDTPTTVEGAAVPSAPKTRPGLHVEAVLVRPIITEKSSLLQNQGQYTFHVAPRSTKQEVALAVERQFGVHVLAVHIDTVRPKPRRRGRIIGEVSGYRKAIVTLRSGESIDLAKGLA